MIKLETQVYYLSTQGAETNLMVRDLHNLMMQAKGARWAILAVGGFAGFMAGFIANAAKLLPWFGNLPK